MHDIFFRRYPSSAPNLLCFKTKRAHCTHVSENCGINRENVRIYNALCAQRARRAEWEKKAETRTRNRTRNTIWKVFCPILICSLEITSNAKVFCTIGDVMPRDRPCRVLRSMWCQDESSNDNFLTDGDFEYREKSHLPQEKGEKGERGENTCSIINGKSELGRKVSENYRCCLFSFSIRFDVRIRFSFARYISRK